MKSPLTTFFCSLIFGVTALQAEQRTVTIAAVNNPDMLELKKLSSKFEQKNPNITHSPATLVPDSLPTNSLRSSQQATLHTHASAQTEKNVAGASGVIMVPMTGSRGPAIHIRITNPTAKSAAGKRAAASFTPKIAKHAEVSQ